jgi:hypothetical protein
MPAASSVPARQMSKNGPSYTPRRCGGDLSSSASSPGDIVRAFFGSFHPGPTATSVVLAFAASQLLTAGLVHPFLALQAGPAVIELTFGLYLTNKHARQVQPRHWLTLRGNGEFLANTFFNWFFNFALLYCTSSPWEVSPFAGTRDVWLCFVYVSFQFISYDLATYFVHRFVLHKVLASWHKKHHSVKCTSAWTTWYGHPVDIYLQSAFPVQVHAFVVQYVILGGRPLPFVWIAASHIFTEIKDNAAEHARVPNAFLDPGDMHYLHHKLWGVNFGVEWLDRLLGTYCVVEGREKAVRSPSPLPNRPG